MKLIAVEPKQHVELVETFLVKTSPTELNTNFFQRLGKRIETAKEDAQKGDKFFNLNDFCNSILIDWFTPRRNWEISEYSVVDRCWIARMYLFYISNDLEFPEDIKPHITLENLKLFFTK